MTTAFRFCLVSLYAGLTLLSGYAAWPDDPPAPPAAAVVVAEQAKVISISDRADLKIGEVGTISITSTGKHTKWWAEPGLNVIREYTEPSKVILKVWGVRDPATKTYRLLAWTAVNDEPTDAVVCVVVVQGDGTTPTPVPVPPGPTPPGPTPPTPTPTPVVAQKVFVCIIEESDVAVKSRSDFATDPTLHAYLKEKGHGFLMIDQNIKDKNKQTPAELAPYLAKVQGKQLPQVVFASYKTGYLATEKRPNTPAELLASIRKYDGSKP